MSVTSATSATGAAAGTTATTTVAPKDTLGKDDFLKLLVTQLQHQDPLAPMEDKDFIAQMAQFSSLEQMKNMNTSVQVTQAASFIGKQVTWSDDTGTEKTGIVSAVRMVTGEPKLIIGEDKIALNKIITVTTAPADTTTATTTDTATTTTDSATTSDKKATTTTEAA